MWEVELETCHMKSCDRFHFGTYRTSCRGLVEAQDVLQGMP